MTPVELIIGVVIGVGMFWLHCRAHKGADQ